MTMPPKEVTLFFADLEPCPNLNETQAEGSGNAAASSSSLQITPIDLFPSMKTKQSAVDARAFIHRDASGEKGILPDLIRRQFFSA